MTEKEFDQRKITGTGEVGDLATELFIMRAKIANKPELAQRFKDFWNEGGKRRVPEMSHDDLSSCIAIFILLLKDEDFDERLERDVKRILFSRHDSADLLTGVTFAMGHMKEQEPKKYQVMKEEFLGLYGE